MTKPNEFHVYKLLGWVKLTAEPLLTFEDALLFAISLPDSGKYVIEGPDWKKSVVYNRDVERVIPPMNHRKPRHSMALPLFEERMPKR